jgi:hypothetical protein
VSWIADVIAGTKILSAWGNAIRDRTISPFVNATERTGSIPAPKVGMTAWQQDTAQLETFDGAVWQPVGPKIKTGAGSGFPAGGGPFIGNVPPSPTFQPMIQAASYVFTTNSLGAWNVQYPVPFPNVLISVVAAWNGIGGYPDAVLVIEANCDLRNYNGVAYSVNGTLLSNAALRLNLIAIGG